MDKTKIKTAADQAFSAGLPKGAKAAAWVVAIGAVAAYTLYENKDNGKIFSNEDQKKWNKDKEPNKGTGK